MRISDRYIGKQVLLGTLYAVLVLSLVMVLGSLFKEIRPLLGQQGATLTLATRLGLVARFVLSFLPFSLMFTIPWAFLTAVLLVFGRLSSTNEITSFRVAGVSLVRLALPVFVIGLLLSGLCLYLNVNVVPLARASGKELIYEQARKDPRSMLDPGRGQAQLRGKQKLFVEGKEGETLLGFHLYQLSEKEGSTEKTYVYSRRSTFIVDEVKKEIRMRLNDAFMEKTLPDGSVEPVLAGELEPLLLAIDAKDRKRTRPTAMTNTEIEAYLKEHPEFEQKKKVEYRAEITKRFSFSMACLAFAFVAVPLGLKSQRKDTSMGLVLSLLLGAGYFLFTVLSSEFKTDLGAAVILWMPNFLCVLIGLFLFRRARFK
jgi:lipopolysaccharide export LptBFGC system permease protein LptF